MALGCSIEEKGDGAQPAKRVRDKAIPYLWAADLTVKHLSFERFTRQTTGVFAANLAVVSLVAFAWA